MTDLLALTEKLVAIPSESRNEEEIAEYVADCLTPFSHLKVERIGNNIVAKTAGADEVRIVVGGHLDTVPKHDGQMLRRDGDILHGLGSADMKASLAIMIDLAQKLENPPRPLTWVFYTCEEIAREESGLNDLFAVPGLLAGEVALLLEPTSCAVEAGCQGTLRMELSFGGVRAHTARPFMGVNAIYRMSSALDALSQHQPAVVDLDGLLYAQQLQVVGVSGGVAANVVPDRATCTLNYRFAPSTTLAAAEQELRDLLAPFLDASLGDSAVLVDGAGGAFPGLTNPLIAALVAATGAPATAKVGWTDCATFAARGFATCNFGPGDPLLAHHPDEHVTGTSLLKAREILESLLG
ncbi:MAG: succinyl-diaminopimelate desuccinylase [Actinomycetota bacterium]